EPLTLSEAETIAIERDAVGEQLRLEATAGREAAQAAAVLPDPEIRFGAMNLPVDSFALDQEPMTQLQLGFRQVFPAGDTLELLERQGEQLAASKTWQVDDRVRQLRFALHQVWFHRQFAAQSAERIADIAIEVKPVLAAAESRYATGGGRQSDFLAAKLKLDRLSERELAYREVAQAATAKLTTLLGDAAYRTARPAQLPEPGMLPQQIDAHPLVKAQEERIAANETAVRLAEEKFGPRWMLDVSYGDRRGVDALGRERPDFASAMVSVSIPVFNRGAKKREVTAAESRRRAADWQRVDLLRQLQGRWQATLASLRVIDSQLALQDEQLLPTARSSRESMARSYANELVSLDDLVQSHLDLLDLELRRLELLKRRALLRAELLYLGGTEQ
ncbi:MAG: TolC family protein, partial [Gammaproteobacteria bacterium]|nr:TolC family protein [Gammaproteobacteria bacterium]